MDDLKIGRVRNSFLKLNKPGPYDSSSCAWPCSLRMYSGCRTPCTSRWPPSSASSSCEPSGTSQPEGGKIMFNNIVFTNSYSFFSSKIKTLCCITKQRSKRLFYNRLDSGWNFRIVLPDCKPCKALRCVFERVRPNLFSTWSLFHMNRRDEFSASEIKAYIYVLNWNIAL